VDNFVSLHAGRAERRDASPEPQVEGDDDGAIILHIAGLHAADRFFNGKFAHVVAEPAGGPAQVTGPSQSGSYQ
jgi:hypothetical protein